MADEDFKALPQNVEVARGLKVLANLALKEGKVLCHCFRAYGIFGRV